MRNYPFIRFSLVFICGILSNYFFESNSQLLFIPLISLFLFSVISYFVKQNSAAKLISIISFYLFFFVLGNFLHAFRVESNTFLPDEFRNIEKLVVIGSVRSIDLKKENEITFEIKTDSIRINKVYQTKEVILICKVRDDSLDLEKLYSRLLPGNLVRIQGTFLKGREDRNPGEFSYNNYLRAKGVSGLLYVKDEYDVKIIDWNSNFFETSIFKVRKFIDSKINSLHNTQSTGLLRGLLLADRSGIDYETKTEFVNSGVMHILAVSGLHVGYIVLIFVVVLGRFNIFIRSILTILGLVTFLLLTGMPSSVFRAVTMSVVIATAYMTNRSSNIYNSLAIAAFIVLALNPEELFSASFQLSFLAVLSITVIYPIIQKFINSLHLNSKIFNYLFLFMGVSLSAQIGTLPLTLIYFGKLSLVALLTNLIVIPLAGVIVGISIFTLVISLFISSLASFYAAANELIIFVLFKIISFAGSSFYSFIPIRNFTFYDTCIFYLALSLIILGMYKIKSINAKLTFISLVIANSVLFSSSDNKNLLETGKFSLMMIDASQGNAILIKFPNGKTAMINSGGASFYFDSGERIIKPLLNHLEIDKIDYAFISNIKQDNFGGFISLIKSGQIKSVVKPFPDSNFLVDVKFEELLHSKKIPITYFQKGILKIGSVRIYFLNDEIDSVSNKQRNSARAGVLKIVYGQTSFLFPGDIENEEEYLYCNEYENFLKSDVLVVANYGKSVSSSVQFLKKVQPKISLVSTVIRNKFDYPSSYILYRLKLIKSKIYRTDEEGAILLESNGSQINKRNWKQSLKK